LQFLSVWKTNHSNLSPFISFPNLEQQVPSLPPPSKKKPLPLSWIIFTQNPTLRPSLFSNSCCLLSVVIFFAAFRSCRPQFNYWFMLYRHYCSINLLYMFSMESLVIKANRAFLKTIVFFPGFFNIWIDHSIRINIYNFKLVMWSFILYFFYVRLKQTKLS